MSNDERLLEAGRNLMLDLEKHGFTSYMVGGTVRNGLLGIPIKDVDIVTNCPMETLNKLYKCYEIGKGKDNGALLVRGLGGFSDLLFDVLQFRREEDGYSDGRRPDKVAFGVSMHEDAIRRDFTINALYMDRHAKVFDPTELGLEDIKSRTLRSVRDPETMLNDDKVRILRALRFVSVLDGFAIENRTLAAIERLAPQIATEPAQRITKELFSAIEKGGGPLLAEMIEQMDRFGVLEHALPDVFKLKGLLQNVEHHPEGDVYEHTLAALRESDSKDPLTLFAVLFHDIGKITTYEFRKDKGHTYYSHDDAGEELAYEAALRMKFSKADARAIAFCARNHMRGHKLGEMKPSKVHAIVTSDHFQMLKHVVYCDEACRGVGRFNPEETRERFAEAEKIASRVSDRIQQAKTPKVVDGHQILAAASEAGIQLSGPEVGMVKDFVIDQVLNSGACPSQIDDLITQGLQLC